MSSTPSSWPGKLVWAVLLFLVVLYFTPWVALGLLAALSLAVRTLLQLFFGAL